MDVHKKIKLMRLSKEYTQNYMADELGIDVTNYSRLERGESQISIERLAKIADILEVDMTSLLNNSTCNSTEDKLSYLLQEILQEVKTIRKKLE